MRPLPSCFPAPLSGLTPEPEVCRVPSTQDCGATADGLMGNTSPLHQEAAGPPWVLDSGAPSPCSSIKEDPCPRTQEAVSPSPSAPPGARTNRGFMELLECLL